MREVRITFGSDDFAAVTSHMIELGVRFRVEPLDADVPPAAPAATRRRESKPKAASRKPPASAGESAGAARLRAMAERNRAAAGKPEGETGEATRSLPDTGSAFGDT